ncbi:MAG: hypothetical protein Q9217_001969 [Psora testacea]
MKKQSTEDVIDVMQNERNRAPSTLDSAYIPPQHGLISIIPSSWVPYAELMRIGRPAGFYAYYLPYLIGLGYAATVADPIPPPHHLLGLSCLFQVGCIILRGIACAWNDNIDQEYDRQVTRCKLRPIARGAVSTTQAHIFTAALILAGVPLFYFLPIECAYHAISIIILFGTYPFMKRITYYPQFVLGFPFAWEILMSCAALNVDPLREHLIIPTMCLIAANICWTMIYDTIYAHQDLQDDVKAGVKSMAVRFADNTKTLASILSLIQVGLLVITGRQAGLSPIYFLGTCAGSAIALGSMIRIVDLKRPASCAWFFYYGFFYVGGAMLSGFLGEYLLRCRIAG